MYAGKIIESSVHRRAVHPHAPPVLRGAAGLGPEARAGRLDPPRQHPGPAARPRPSPSTSAGSPRAVATCRSDCRASEPPLERAARGTPRHLAACFHQVGVDERTMAKRPDAVAKSADPTVTVDEVSSARHRARADELARQPVLLDVVATGEGVPRHLGRDRPAQDRGGQGGLRRDVLRAPGRDLRPGGRVRVRQDDDRTARGVPRVGGVGQHPFEGEDAHDPPGRGPPAPPSRHAAHVPGPLRLARPPHACGRDRQGAAGRPADRDLAPSATAGRASS